MHMPNPIRVYRERRLEEAVTEEGVRTADQLFDRILGGVDDTFTFPLAAAPRGADVSIYREQVRSVVEASLGAVGLEGQVEFDDAASDRRSATLVRIGRPNSPAGWMPAVRQTPTLVFNRVSAT